MITQEELKQLLSYDPETGEFVWLVSRRCIKKGSIAGCVGTYSKGRKYKTIRVNGKSFMAHRLAFIYMEGKELPKEVDVDHINGNGLNNKWLNLRKVTRIENMQNTKLHKRNKSGVCGVSWIKKSSKWYACIRANGKSRSLGEYINKDDAIKARKQAEIAYGFHANHGNQRLQYIPSELSK